MNTALHLESTAISSCAHPTADPAVAARELTPVVAGLARTGSEDAERLASGLVALARIYGTEPFTTLEQAREQLAVGRDDFARLLELFGEVPQLRTAVETGPAGMYWVNTLLPLERDGALDAALHGTYMFPRIVGLFPGPTCMFRCSFCARATGARYQQSSLADGNAMFASLIDEMPLDNPTGMYVSGGLEPLTNPQLGELVARAAARGLRMPMYSNSFALTEQTLNRQPGLWDLSALRTSLYGLNDEEYEQTTTKRNAFTRVRKNLTRVQQLRQERDAGIKLGFSYIILPGRADRLTDLVDFIAELNDAAPERPIDTLSLREDYSNSTENSLPVAERIALQEALAVFEERVRSHTPTLKVDYGYALHSLRMGADAKLLRINDKDMRPRSHPQTTVQIDLLGDVYLYRGAAFPDLKGSDKYSIGRLAPGDSLGELLERFITSGAGVESEPGDEYLLDGFDQVITARLRQMEADVAAGWGEARGFLR
ncbi:dTDP-4-amino-4,6-dideoxy-D-glucose ammonia-lyase [Allokutzneria oryzae]|uniref:dTDP-4-amino-4,6-dideoxy-D-glucose ammonia-lyase n=1 Tax=Allokutzneria oryzae TaxID=1378989 RepID=A0ABV5ZTG7_9PSEU